MRQDAAGDRTGTDAIEQFLARLRRTPRRWTVGENLSGSGIRLRVPGELDRCPITAVCGGTGINPRLTSCMNLGLSERECYLIVAAADWPGNVPQHRWLRARLLEACGLAR